MERDSNGKFQKKTGLYYEPHYHALCQKLCDMKRRCRGKGGFAKMTRIDVKAYCKERAVAAWNRRTDNA